MKSTNIHFSNDLFAFKTIGSVCRVIKQNNNIKLINIYKNYFNLTYYFSNQPGKSKVYIVAMDTGHFNYIVRLLI